MKQLLPSTSQIIEIVRDQLNLEVNDDNTVKIDLSEIVRDNVDLGERTFTFQLPFNLSSLFPAGFDLTRLDNLGIKIPGSSLFSGDSLGDSAGLTPSELLQGKVTIKLDFMAAFLDQADLTSLDVPIDDIVNSLLNVTFLPRALAHNFTVVHSYSESFGKTADNSGNSAIVDCHFLNQVLLTTFGQTFDRIVDINPFFFVFLKTIRQDVDAALEKVNFCKYAMNVNGQLKDQMTVYGGSKEEQAK